MNSAEDKAGKLTDKQKKFCEEYLIDLNATQAAIRAGYSEDTATEIGYENLRKPHIQEYVQSAQKALSEKTGITHERLLAEYAKIAFSDIRELYAGDNQLLDVRQMDDTIAGAVMSVEVDEMYAGTMIIGHTKKVKLYNKLQALDSIGKHLGFFEVDNKQKSPVLNMPAINVYNQGPPLATSENEIDV